MVVEPADPHLDAAREIIATNDFAKQVNAVLDANGAIGPLRDRLYAEAISFGPTLDLEKWFDYVAEHVEKLPVQEPLDDILDEMIDDGGLG